MKYCLRNLAAAVVPIAVTFYVSITSTEEASTDRGEFNGGFASTVSVGRSPRVAREACGWSKYANAGSMDLPRPRIIGGQEAREYEFPWQVSMIYLGDLICGGTIIGSKWVITAAHCVTPFTSLELKYFVAVAVGVYRLDDTSSTVRQIIGIARATTGNYNSGTFENDIALLELSGNITFSNDVSPVCLPQPNDTFLFQQSVASGWGATYPGSSGVSNVLLYTTLNVTSNSICDSIYYPVYNRSIIASSMLCTRDNINDSARDTCQGDSGGPLVVKGIDGRFVLAGIISWGYGCSAGFPGVYTRVTSYLDFIDRLAGISPRTSVTAAPEAPPAPVGSTVAQCRVFEDGVGWVFADCNRTNNSSSNYAASTATVVLLAATALLVR